MERKTRSDALSEKLSEAQNGQLINWLACHDYDEVLELIKADPPTGFGLAIHKSTLSRYFQEHSYEIDKIRQNRILCRALENQRILAKEEGMRYFYHQAAALRIQEHLYDLLSRPGHSAADLKTLASVTRLITQLDVDLRDPDQDEKTMLQLQQILNASQPKSNPPNNSPVSD